MYKSWTQLERYPGNPNLEQECTVKTFYDPRLDENVDVYVFGKPDIGYFYSNKINAIGYGYTMGVKTMKDAQEFVDHVYHSFYNREDISENVSAKP